MQKYINWKFSANPALNNRPPETNSRFDITWHDSVSLCKNLYDILQYRATYCETHISLYKHLWNNMKACNCTCSAFGLNFCSITGSENTTTYIYFSFIFNLFQIQIVYIQCCCCILSIYRIQLLLHRKDDHMNTVCLPILEKNQYQSIYLQQAYCTSFI